MKFICSVCNELIEEEYTIVQDINDHIRFLCGKCFSKWRGDDASSGGSE